MKRRIAIIAGLPLIFIGLVVVAGVIFQNNLSRFLINPRMPFQTAEKPRVPDYTDKASWALWPQKVNRTQSDVASIGELADIFYVHGTTFDRRSGWNAAIDDEDAVEVLDNLTIPNQLGPFFRVGDVYAPRYRQATLFARFTHKYDGIAARELAYEDVRAAFIHYLQGANAERPLVLVGYDQGGLYILSLLQEFFAEDAKLRQRLSAAYIIHFPVAMSLFSQGLSTIAPCMSKTAFGCVVSYNHYEAHFHEEIQRVRTRTLIPEASKGYEAVKAPDILCINPLSWKQSETYEGAQAHQGGASATGLLLEQKPAIIKQAVGAICDDGVLILDKPANSFLRRKRWFGRQWRPQPFNLFYGDLQEDSRRRVAIHAPLLREQARILEPIPIEEAVDLQDSPINKVPN